MDFNKINFILGNKCNSECDHCFTNSTPKAKDKLLPSLAINYYLKLSTISFINEIHFNGGEPFLYLPEMVEISSVIKTYNESIKVKIATGCFEFDTYENTRDILSSLPRINEIWASIDTYHLKKTSINNYINLQRYCRENNIYLVFSICYNSIDDLTNILILIENNNLQPNRVTKQPVFSYGRATALNTLINFTNEVPEEYSCPEIDIISVWPDGRLATCSAVCSRNGKVRKSPNFESFQKDLLSDTFYNLRKSLSFKKIIENHTVSGPFDITTPCSLCSSLLSKGIAFGS